MSTQFKLDLLDFDQQVIETEIEFTDLQYNRTFGSTGAMVVTLPSHYDQSMFGRDSMLRLYRTPEDGPIRLEPNAIWLVRKVGINYDDRTVVLTCVDQNDILRRRIVAYRQYTTYADKTAAEYNGPDYADDMMKEYVYQNLGAGTVIDGSAIPDEDRDLSDWISIEADDSAGPQVEQSGAFQRLSDVLSSIKNSASNSGVDLYYDLRVRSSGTFEFVTPFSALGAYHDPDIASFRFNAEDGNLTNLTIERDYTDEITVAYVTCGGIGIGQHYIRVESNRATLTPFNRIETHIPADENNDEFLTDIASAALEGGKPKVRLEAKVIDSPIAVYGRDFYYGDRVVVSVGGMEFDCIIDSVRNRVSGRGENLDIGLTGLLTNEPDTLNELDVWSLRNYVHATVVGGYIEIAPP